MTAYPRLVPVLVVVATTLAGCGLSVGGGGAVRAPRAATAAPASNTAESTAVSTAAPAVGPGPSAATTSMPSPTGTTSPTSVPSPTGMPSPPSVPSLLMTPGAGGDPVRELQARLAQLQWLDADVTGAYDGSTTAGVRGFQDKRGLPATGSVDQATWDALVGMTRQPTDDELRGRLVPGPALLRPGSTGTQVRELQARLDQIGWWSGDVSDTYGATTVAAVRGFQDKRHIPVTGEVDRRTLDRVLGMTRPPTSDELANTRTRPATGTTAGLDPRCLTGRVVCISKAARSLTWVVDGQARLRVDVRFGSEYTPTRDGSFTVYRKNRDWTSTIYGSKMPYSMFFSGGQAVHYSSDFAARGYAGASHGCVNVRDLAGIAQLFDQVQLGDPVIVS